MEEQFNPHPEDDREVGLMDYLGGIWKSTLTKRQTMNLCVVFLIAVAILLVICIVNLSKFF